MKKRVDDSFHTFDHGPEEFGAEGHDECEQVERQPGHEEDHCDGQDKHVGAAAPAHVLSVLALKGPRREEHVQRVHGHVQRRGFHFMFRVDKIKVNPRQ